MNIGFHSLSSLTISLSQLDTHLQGRVMELPTEPPFIRNGRLCKECSFNSVPWKPWRYFPARHQGSFPASVMETCLHALASSYMFANSYIKPYTYLWPTLLQSNSIQVAIHLMSIPVRSRFLVWLTGFRAPVGKRLRNLTVDCDDNSPLLNRGFDIEFSLPPYIARIGRPRLVYMH